MLFSFSFVVDVLVCITCCWPCEVVEVVGESVVWSPTCEEVGVSLVVIISYWSESFLRFTLGLSVFLFLYMFLNSSLGVSATAGDFSSLILFVAFSCAIGVCNVEVDTNFSSASCRVFSVHSSWFLYLSISGLNVWR